jgi:glycosyltransferase involved in cell wall biosynthesis
MQVWLVNLFDPMPSADGYVSRTESLALALVDVGATVTWFTSDWEHRSKTRRRPDSFQGHPFRVLPVPTLEYHRNVSLRRFRSHARIGKDWLRMVRHKLESGDLLAPDLVLVNLPPPSMGAAVAALKQVCNFTMVCDVQDAWPENFSQLLPFGQPLNDKLGAFLFRPLKRAGCRAYAAADAITAVSRDYLDLVANYTEHAGKVFYIGCPKDRLEHVPLPYSQRKLQPFKMVYVGGFSRSYDLMTLIAGMAMPELRGRSLELHFAGSGRDETRLQAEVSRLGLQDYVSFHGMLDQAALRRLLENCHLGLNAVQASSLIAMPNKVGDYLSAGLPLLHSIESGELADLIRNEKFGAFYTAGDPASFARAVVQQMEAPEPVLAQQSERARRFALERLDRAQIYSKFAEWLRGLIIDD